MIGLDYYNYHKHTHLSNLRTLDCVVKPEDYCKRAVELGHKAYFTTEHGYTGNVFEANTLCEKYGLKLIVGAEVYFVPVKEEKDNRNYHLMLVALNDAGYKELNKVLSLANTDGFYYKPRIDFDLLLSMNPKNIVVTTACVGGVARDNTAEMVAWLKKIHNHFEDNFFLEVQCHTHPKQANHNRKIIKLSNELGIRIIHANDSHYITEKDAEYRDLFLQAKGIKYEEEEGFILDYPSSDVIVDRYRKQGILTEDEIKYALRNTRVFDKCQKLDINYDIKLPQVSQNPTEELKTIIRNAWIVERNNIPREEWQDYLEAIRYEMDIIEETGMENYFILDNKIVERGISKYDGVLTKTGRGSAPSFYITKLLGLTDIDRLGSPITLYPTRFMSAARILQTRSLPDIDLNTSNPDPFTQATKDILGEDGCYYMISYKPLQDSSAFRLFCKAKGYHIDEYNEIAKNLEEHLENPQWKDIIEESKVFKGVIESVSPSPCSFLLLDKPISEEIGLMRVGDIICCNIDGYNCDVYKYLKNDVLTVTVLGINAQTCKLAGIEMPTIKELNELLDEKTFKMYELGLTATLNQADSDFATPLVMKYAPKTVDEMSAFVAAIRPGFASLLNNFLERKPYTTGVKELDELLKESYHYMLYQESIMKYLIWLGIEESESYDILKKIAKKKFKEEELQELHKTLEDNWVAKIGTIEGFQETWQVVEDAAKYSFNASHSLSYAYDSLYGAYLKSHYPLEYYSVILNTYSGNVEKTAKIVKELPYFGITLEPAQFGKSKDTYFFDRDTSTIYKGIASIKYVNEKVGQDLYELSKGDYKDFVDVLCAIKGHLNTRQLDVLIRIGYFRQYGTSKKLLAITEVFSKIYGKKTFKYDNPYIDFILPLAQSKTAKMVKEVDTMQVAKNIFETLPDDELPTSEIVKSHMEYMGSCEYIDETFGKRDFIVVDIDTKYTPTLKIYKPCSGTTTLVKVKKKFYETKPLSLYQSIYVDIIEEKDRVRKEGNQWIPTGEKYYYITYFKTNK